MTQSTSTHFACTVQLEMMGGDGGGRWTGGRGDGGRGVWEGKEERREGEGKGGRGVREMGGKRGGKRGKMAQLRNSCGYGEFADIYSVT